MRAVGGPEQDLLDDVGAGIGVDPDDGQVYYADLGIGTTPPGPVGDEGDVYRVPFDGAGDPLTPLLELTTWQLLNLGVGDPRWSGATPLIGAVVGNQSSIVRYLVEQGARLDTKTALGWTALHVAEGVFFANAKKEFPQAAAILKQAAAKP